MTTPQVLSDEQIDAIFADWCDAACVLHHEAAGFIESAPGTELSRNDVVQLMRVVESATLKALGGQEPVYQLQLCSGAWIDQSEHQYTYNKASECNVVRVLYTLPPAQPSPDFIQAITDPENQPSQFGTVTLDFHFEKIKEWEDKFDRLFELHTSRQAAQPAPVDEPSGVFATWWNTQGQSMTQHASESPTDFARRLAAWAWFEAARAALQGAQAPQATKGGEA